MIIGAKSYLFIQYIVIIFLFVTWLHIVSTIFYDDKNILFPKNGKTCILSRRYQVIPHGQRNTIH